MNSDNSFTAGFNFGQASIFFATSLGELLMFEDIYFHDGNIFSFSISTVLGDYVCEILMNLYKNEYSPERVNYLIKVINISRVSIIGDFLEIKKNRFAGAVEDGSIRDEGGFHRLTIKITGGYLEILGYVSVDVA